MNGRAWEEDNNPSDCVWLEDYPLISLRPPKALPFSFCIITWITSVQWQLIEYLSHATCHRNDKKKMDWNNYLKLCGEEWHDYDYEWL